MKFLRTITYEINAPTVDAAEEIWADDGPELADTRTIAEVDDSGLTAAESA